MTPARRQHLGRRICSDLDQMPSAQPTAVLYFVICQFKDGRASVERDTTRMNRADTIEDIRSGELSDVVTVIETEFMPHGLSGLMNSRDVTADILAEAEELRAHDRSPIMSALDRLLADLDHDRDERKHQEA